MNIFGSYTKFVSAIVTAIIAWVTVVTQSAPAAISAAEWVAGAVLLAGALGVYGGSNATKT